MKIKVDSISSNFANDLFDELEEQVVRTGYSDNMKSIKNKVYSVFLVLLFAFFIIVPMYAAISSEYRFSERLSADEIIDLLPVFDKAITVDDKVDAIFRMYNQILINNTNTPVFFKAVDFFEGLLRNHKFYIFLASLLAIVFLLKSLFKTSLGSVFLWGDFTEYVKIQDDKRSSLTNILVGSIFAGLLVNALFFSLT